MRERTTTRRLNLQHITASQRYASDHTSTCLRRPSLCFRRPADGKQLCMCPKAIGISASSKPNMPGPCLGSLTQKNSRRRIQRNMSIRLRMPRRQLLDGNSITPRFLRVILVSGLQSSTRRFHGDFAACQCGDGRLSSGGFGITDLGVASPGLGAPMGPGPHGPRGPATSVARCSARGRTSTYMARAPPHGPHSIERARSSACSLQRPAY